MRLTGALVACLLPLAAYGKACEGEDLPPDAKIRIGIKHRPEDCSQKAKNGDRLRVHYEGKLYKDCAVFDSNKKGDTPFAFVLGARSVIKGWDQGLIGMCVGERRRFQAGHIVHTVFQCHRLSTMACKPQACLEAYTCFRPTP
eukprot:1527-Heterococcus_DN1.PRE.3